MVLEGFYGPITELQTSALIEAKQSSDRLLKIIESFLHISSLESGNLSLTFAKCNLTALLSSIINEQSQQIKKRSQNIVYSRDKNNVTSNVDEHFLRMAFENIVENASKYSGSDTTIVVKLQVSIPLIVIDITDQGIGIAKEDIHSIFQKFTRVQHGKAQEQSGTGIGLYWASEVIALHHGSITASSVPHKGTTFTIVLPLTRCFTT